MRVLKELIKSIIRIIYKIRIAFHIKQSVKLEYNESLEYLNNIYSIKAYDLRETVMPIKEYNYDISIIVPIYNASSYLKQCIDSLISQKTKYKYEVICIDDGSTDDSLQILQNYKNSFIKVIHQNNSGISSARNEGLKISTGKYIGFVDNDDYVSEDYIEKLLDSAICSNADYVRCSYKVFDNNTNKTIEKVIYDNVTYKDLNASCDYNLLLKGYMWGGCFKRELWNNFCFPIGYWYEDIIKSLYLYNICNIITEVNEIMYLKRSHNANASNILWKNNDIKCLDHLYLVYEINKLKKERNIKENNLSYYSKLNELGEYLYKRINNLPIEIQKKCFVIARNIYNDNTDKKVIINGYKLKNIEKSFVDNDFRLWQLVGEYSRYE